MTQSEATKASVIVSSERASNGTYIDTCGPAASSWLTAHACVVEPIVLVADDRSALTVAVTSAVAKGQHLVVISGGTGLGSKDFTPQLVDKLCDYSIPGIGELLRRESLKYSLGAYLSRCGAWVKDGTLILALPGEPKAMVDHLGILSDLLPQALRKLRNSRDHRSTMLEAHV